MTPPTAREVLAPELTAIRAALEKVGIEFINGGEPGVRCRKIGLNPPLC